jgi:hypothetical protein
VIASAVALAVWDAVGVYGGYSAPLKLRLFELWFRFVTIAWGGVALILLAELLDSFSNRSSREARKSGHRIRYRRRVSSEE